MRRAGGLAEVAAPLLVVLAVLCSAWPVRDLFDTATWIPPLGCVLLLIAATGAVLRARPSGRRRPEIVIGGQLLAYLVGLVVFFHGDTLAGGLLPTPSTVQRWSALLTEAGETLSRYPAPAPLTDGTAFLLVCSVAGIGFVADIVAVTWRRPALAGLVILAPFLVAVANSDGGLHPGYFATTALAWLALLAGSDRELFATWGARDRVGRTDRSASPSASGAAVASEVSGAPGAASARPAGTRGRTRAVAVLAVAAVALSLVASSFLPHLSVRYLADGLGVGPSGGRGEVGFSPSAQMIQDLRNTDDSPILRYRTNDPTPPPLRVSVAVAYTEARWWPAYNDAEPTTSPTLSFPVGWQRDAVPATTQRFEVEDNRLAAPFLAAPPEVTEGSVIDAQWAHAAQTGVLVVDRTPAQYRLSYLELDPTPQLLREPQGRHRGLRDALRTDGASPTLVDTTMQIVADAEADTPYDQALAIQEWLRSSGNFTYSLELAPPPPEMSEQEAAATAVDRFLETKRGYCVQFSTTMALMARTVGIPARIATGFLPGTEVDGWRQVRASDAHAWPELYFEGAGWLRFEPTPGARSGAAPGYSLIRSTTAAPTATPSATTSAAPTPTASASPSRPVRDERDTDAAPAATQASGRWGWYALGVLLVALLAAVVPLLARRARRASVETSTSEPDRIEAHWVSLLDRLSDLGVRIDPALQVPQQVAAIRDAGPLHGPAVEAVERLGRSVESARYAPDVPSRRARSASGSRAGQSAGSRRDSPTSTTRSQAGKRSTSPIAEERSAADLQAESDALVVYRAMARARRHPIRLKAALWPGAGTRSLERSVRRPLSRLADHASTVASRRGRPSETEDDPALHRPPAPTERQDAGRVDTR